MGIPVYNADIRAKDLMVSNAKVVEGIRSLFGPKAYLTDGTLNRLFIAGEVFKNSNQLASLNSIVHPVVKEDFEHWLGHFGDKPYIIKEAALLLESGSYKDLDWIVVVVAPEDMRISRIIARDPHRDVADIHRIIQNQSSDQEKMAIASFIINNTPENLVLPQVLKIHEFLANMA